MVLQGAKREENRRMHERVHGWKSRERERERERAEVSLTFGGVNVLGLRSRLMPLALDAI